MFVSKVTVVTASLFLQCRRTITASVVVLLRPLVFDLTQPMDVWGKAAGE